MSSKNKERFVYQDSTGLELIKETSNEDVKKSEELIPLSGEQYTTKENFLKIYEKYFGNKED